MAIPSVEGKRGYDLGGYDLVCTLPATGRPEPTATFR
jgi:hypothetical protein